MFQQQLADRPGAQGEAGHALAQAIERSLFPPHRLFELRRFGRLDAPGCVVTGADLFQLGELDFQLGCQLSVDALHHRITGPQRIAWTRHGSRYETSRLGAQQGLFRQAQHALGMGVIGHRHDKQQQIDSQESATQHRADARASRGETRLRQQRAADLEPGKSKAGDQAPDRQQDADNEILLRHEQGDAEQNEHSISEGKRRVADKPAALTDGRRGRLALRYIEQISLGQILPVLGRARPQIGYLHPIRQDVITVVSEQRIGVEQDGGHTGQNKGVVSQ